MEIDEDYDDGYEVCLDVQELLPICYEKERYLMALHNNHNNNNSETTTSRNTTSRWTARGGGIHQARRQRADLLGWLAEFAQAEGNKTRKRGDEKEKEDDTNIDAGGEIECISISRHTLHSAIGMLEEVERHYHTWNSLCLAAMACLLIAGKMEEREADAPTPVALAMVTGDVFPPLLIRRAELLVLNQLGWQTMRLTPIVFLDHFISLGGCKVYLQADQFQLKPISQDLTVTLQHYLQEYANFFCDFAVLHDLSLSGELPSILAASAIGCARRMMKITPAWPDHLRDTTHYSPSEVGIVIERMWACYQAAFVNIVVGDVNHQEEEEGVATTTTDTTSSPELGKRRVSNQRGGGGREC